MGAASAYFLGDKGRSVTVLDQYDIPNQWSQSGDQLRIFRLTYGKDAFYTDMAAKSLPLWLQFNELAAAVLLQQNGVLELATETHGYEEQSLKVLKDMRLPVSVLDKDHIKRHYPMINTKAIKFGLFHKDGGMLWAQRAVSSIMTLAQRKGVRTRPHTKIVSILKGKEGIKGLKDANGKLWQAESYLFTAGAWTTELLKSYGIPLKVTRQQQLYLRPPANRGRYRPEHFPAFAARSQGFYGFPLHIHGFLKIGDHDKGPVGKPGPEAGDSRELSSKFEKKCRAFLQRHIPELAKFTEMEGHACYYDNTKDEDFILDRLPDAPNAFIAAGFSGHGFKFAPIVGKTMAQLLNGAKPDLNLHRFRLSRFKLKKS